jgi:ABC-type multidrug transport system ATPase subunit
MIEVQNVTKKYGKHLAGDDITLRVGAGELAILLGPNGAGKSTLIKSICGLLRFQGHITIDGLINNTPEAKAILGYVPEFHAVYQMLTVGEHMEFIAKAYRLTDYQGYANELLARFELDDKQKKLGKELSKGMQQKVSVCCALLPRPRAIIFDEPFVGLDPHGIRELKTVLAERKKDGCALIVSTHMIDSFEDNWDVTYIMQKGRLVRACKRSEIDSAQTLESVFFAITEGEKTTEGET